MADLDHIRHSVELERRLDDLSRPEIGQTYQPVTGIKGWDGAANKDTQTIDLQAAPWSLPANIQAVSCRLYYIGANVNDYGALEKSAGDGHMVIAQIQAAGGRANTSGIVNCDSSGDIRFETNNATNTVSLYINGYFS